MGAAALAGGIFGALGTICFFLAFSTDYWLVASDNCGPYSWHTTETIVEKDANGTEVRHDMNIVKKKKKKVKCIYRIYEAKVFTI